MLGKYISNSYVHSSSIIRPFDEFAETPFFVMDLLEFAQASQKVEAPSILWVHNFIVLLETSSISDIPMMWGLLHSPSLTWNLNMTVSKWESPILWFHFQVRS